MCSYTNFILRSGYSRCIGVQNGDVHITADLVTSLFRASTRGAAYRCNWFLDALFDLIAFVRFMYQRLSTAY